MKPTTNIAVRAARQAGSILLRYFDHVDSLKVTQKNRNDFVSEVDRSAEEAIISVIRQAYPEHAILAEETGKHDGNDFQWVIDPLDGTTNFLHGFPQFAVSIGLKHKGRLEQAVVYDPLRQELFTASRGSGAFLDNRRIRVSRQTGLNGALLGTGFPYKDQQHLDAYLNMFRALIVDTAGIRRPGSAALDLAYVAAGRLDALEIDLLNPEAFLVNDYQVWVQLDTSLASLDPADLFHAHVGAMDTLAQSLLVAAALQGLGQAPGGGRLASRRRSRA